jgi:gamma-glutamyltranspeptidase/glutathione hydrolase
MAVMRFLRAALVAVVLSVSLFGQEVSQSGLRLDAQRPTVSQPARYRKAVVASVHELATNAGIETLKKGGNAIDAAVAVGFVLAVVHPEAGNLGGSGYALVRLANGKVTAFDYLGEAPSGVSPQTFAQNRREANVGYKSILVPGTVAGLGLMHQRYGRLKWDRCLEPAQRLASKGFPASQRLELILKLQVPVMKPYPETARIFLHGGERPLVQEEPVIQKDLADTIKRIQKKGWREFYQGRTAEWIAADMQANGGFVTLEDLHRYQARETEPLKVTYRKHPVLTMSPSSSGGVALGVMLNVASQFALEVGQEGSAASRHLQVEAMRRGFAARLSAIETDFGNLEQLLSESNGAALASSISEDKATATVQRGPDTESTDTTHFTIVDPDGNVVSNTYTLSGFFGSQVVARKTGVLMNNHMSAFLGSAAQKRLAPGRRYPSTMSPTLVLRPDGTPYFALGTPGAATIPSTLFQVISNIIDFKMSVRDAIEFPRIHADTGAVEAEPAALVFDVADRLQKMGHKVNPRLRSQGDVQAVLFDSGGWILAWADGRRGGSVKGF